MQVSMSVLTVLLPVLFWGFNALVEAEATTSIWLLGNHTSLHGSVITADANATTWSLNCAESSYSGCSLPPLTLTQGPSTLAYNYVINSANSFHVACKLTTSAPSAACTLSLDAGTDSAIKTTTLGTPALNQVAITITAGPGASSSASTTTRFNSTAYEPIPTGSFVNTTSGSVNTEPMVPTKGSAPTASPTGISSAASFSLAPWIAYTLGFATLVMAAQ